jgi:type I restriction enzyme S subunit
MASKWEKKKLAQCCEFNPSSLRTDWPHTHLQYIDISSVGKGVQSEPFKRMLRSEAPSRAQRLVASGDSLLSTVRPNRRSMLWLDSVADDVVASTGFAVLRAKPNVMASRFLYYTIFNQAFTDYLVTMEKGAAYPAVSVTDIGNAEINLPSLEEQTAIGEVLGALDDKIKTNSRMNSTLEAMASAIFQSWFVDFDPVREKLKKAKPIGIDGITAKLFPDSFQNTLFGHIPKNWMIGKVSDVATLSRDSINPGHFPMEVFEHYSLPAFDNHRTPNIELGREIMSNKFIISPNSVLLSKLNPHIQRIWLPDLSPTCRSICSTEFIVATSNPKYSREYLFSLFTSSSFASIYGTLVTGTTGSHQRVSLDSFLEIKIVIPPLQLIEAFTEKVKPIFDRINCNIEQSQRLAAIRDALLPKLMSGELSVENLQS